MKRTLSHSYLLVLLLVLATLPLTACKSSGSDATDIAEVVELEPQPEDENLNPEDETDKEPEEPTVEEPTAVNLQWQHYERAEDYPNTKKETVWIPVKNKDGSILDFSATLTRPADENGNVVNKKLPTIATFTGYNQSLMGMAPGELGSLAGSSDYLVKRGYNTITIDTRGTGSTGGAWQAFGELSTQHDIPQLLEYIGTQDWSDGNIGATGPSLMGINALFAGATESEYLKAIYAIVPMADAYRDIVFQGGQINVGFIPLWIGLVEGLGLPPTPAEFSSDNPTRYLQKLVGRLTNLVTEEFPVGTITQALLNQGDTAYDSDFWRERSVIEYADKIKVPTFIVGGLDDLFQRGEPLLYEALKGHTTAKLLMGPWSHFGGSAVSGLTDYGLPSSENIQLAWFDQYLKGLDAGAEEMPPVTQYFKGADYYRTSSDWVHPDTYVETFYLHGKPPIFEGVELPVQDLGQALDALLEETQLNNVTDPVFDLVKQLTFGIVDLKKNVGSVTGILNPDKIPDMLATLMDPAPGGLSKEAPAAQNAGARSSMLQHPIGGVCSRSTSQWTAGLVGMLLPFCTENNNINETLEVVFTTEPFTEDMIINGPIAAELWVSTTAANTGLSVTIATVDESLGIPLSTALTNGILLASMSNLDEAKSRYIDGKLVQPWHPFTKEKEQTLERNKIFPVQVEVFATSAVIKKGQRLRVSIGPSDFPHGLSTVPDLLDGPVGIMTIYSDEEHPSRINIPVIPAEALHIPVQGE